jgi:mono/diheme cytochrome c family protein
MRAIKSHIAAAIAIAILSACAGAAEKATPEKGKSEQPLYTVVDGTKVDADTLQGFRAWRAAACERCHGANQAGLVGPSLLEALKRLTKEQFDTVVLEGRPEKGMPGHKNMKTITANIDNLYAFLKGRSDGAIKAGRLEPLQQ